MRFFISDTHFGHKNIIEYCNRPFKDVSHMNEDLIANWNSVVGEDDVVYHLGDVALGPWEEWDGILTRLNGRKRLIIGNHDRIFAGESERHRERFQEHYDKWFEKTVDHMWVTFDGVEKPVLMSHFPYEADHMDKARYMEHRLPDAGNVLLHGHTHSDKIITSSAKGTLQIHVGADAWDYTPVSEDQISAILVALNK